MIVKVSWAIGEMLNTCTADFMQDGNIPFCNQRIKRPLKGAFIFIFLLKLKEKRKKMKKIISSVLLLTVMLVCITSFVGCELYDKYILQNTVDKAGKWEDAIYRKDAEFGDGAKCVEVEVKVEDQSVTFTIHTDKEMLGDALLEHELIEGEKGAYGLYVKKVNGITADYDVDKTYWALYKNGEYSLTGVDLTPISDGEHYEIVCEG